MQQCVLQRSWRLSFGDLYLNEVYCRDHPVRQSDYCCLHEGVRIRRSNVLSLPSRRHDSRVDPLPPLPPAADSSPKIRESSP